MPISQIKKLRNKTHSLSQLMRLMNGTDLGISTVLGKMCSPLLRDAACLVRNYEWSILAIHVVETSPCAHLGVRILLCGPGVLHYSTSESPKELI